MSGKDAAGEDARGQGPLSVLLSWAVALFAIVALGSAATGWTLYFAAIPDAPVWPGRVSDIAIRSLYVLFLSDIYSDLPAQPGAARLWLEAARLSGAAFALVAAGRIALSVAAQRYTRARIRRWRRHDIALGSGPAAAAYAPACEARVVHVDDHPRSLIAGRHARLQRTGDLEAQLAAAGAGRARRVIIDEGDDARTWQTAQAVARRCPRSPVAAHIRDPWLAERLARVESGDAIVAFSYPSGAARQVMLAHPPYLLARAMGAPAQHIVLFGFSPADEALMREFLVTSLTLAPERMMVTVVDQDANEAEARFRARYPGLDAHVDIAFLEGDLAVADPAVEQRFRDRMQSAEACAAYVTADDEAPALARAVALRDRAARDGLFRAPIFVSAPHGAGLAPVRQGAGALGPPRTDPKARLEAIEGARIQACLGELRLVAFGSWRDALDGAGLFELELDGAAQRFHEAYRDEAIARGRPPPPDWRALPDDLRVPNRRAVAHIRAKADAAGFDVGGWLHNEARRAQDLPADAAARFVSQDPAFVRRMAELEHRRWTIDRLLNGWRRGPARDDVARRHPMLAPFEELQSEEMAKDDTIVRVTQAILSGAKPARRRARR
jgi:voltage-gated potassium channel Kch